MSWKEELDKQFPDNWLGECEFNPRVAIKQFITDLRKKDEVELIKKFKLDVLSMPYNLSELSAIIKLGEQLIKDYYKE